MASPEDKLLVLEQDQLLEAPVLVQDKLVARRA
jgi:hypothetical protein